MHTKEHFNDENTDTMVPGEMHLHTAEVSLCARVPAKEIPRAYAAHGYRCIVVTNHWNEYTLSQFPGSIKQKNEKWLEGYKTVRDEGEKFGIKVLLGMEITLPAGPEDFLIYGMTEEFLREYPRLYSESLATVYKTVDATQMLLIQAHPFRPYLHVANPRYLHGVEVHNGNERHENNNEQALAFAQKHKLLQTSGSDFHLHEDVNRGGIRLPSEIGNSTQLAAFLRKGTHQLYCPAKD